MPEWGFAHKGVLMPEFLCRWVLGWRDHAWDCEYVVGLKREPLKRGERT